jgi:hypothetical protein
VKDSGDVAAQGAGSLFMGRGFMMGLKTAGCAS